MPAIDTLPRSLAARLARAAEECDGLAEAWRFDWLASAVREHNRATGTGGRRHETPLV